MASNDPAAAAVEGNNAGYDFKLYRYDPSLPAAIVATIIFAILTAVHFWRLRRAGAVYFTPFLIGGIFQTIGYCGRIWSHFDKESIGGFVMQAILILVAPALFAASIYMILGRLIRALGAEHLSLIPIKWVTKIFVTGDRSLRGSSGRVFQHPGVEQECCDHEEAKDRNLDEETGDDDLLSHVVHLESPCRLDATAACL